MATKQIEFQPGELKLGDEFENGYEAIANKDAIKEIGKLFLATIGDWKNKEPMVKGERLVDRERSAAGSRRSSRFYGFIAIVDTIMEWIEHSGKDVMPSLKKYETVLRGVFHITELGNQANLFAILELASSFLDVPEDPFPAQREYIVNCLKDIEEQKQRIFQSVEQASRILSEIIDSHEVDVLKGKQFDNVVREAHVQIDSCRRRLAGAEATILELSTKMNTVKWFSRGFRVAGLGVSCCYFYQKYQESSISLPVFVTASGVAGAMWLSLFPSRAYGFYELLSKLASKHRLLNEQLEDLRISLASTKDHRDGVLPKTVVRNKSRTY